MGLEDKFIDWDIEEKLINLSKDYNVNIDEIYLNYMKEQKSIFRNEYEKTKDYDQAFNFSQQVALDRILEKYKK